MINVFIPHRWNNEDYTVISSLLDRSKYVVRDYSVPKDDAFEKIDSRYHVDPQIKQQIKYASVVVCSNRPANNRNHMSMNEIIYALDIGKPIVAVKITDYSSSDIINLGIEIIANRKDALEKWIDNHMISNN